MKTLRWFKRRLHRIHKSTVKFVNRVLSDGVKEYGKDVEYWKAFLYGQESIARLVLEGFDEFLKARGKK